MIRKHDFLQRDFLKAVFLSAAIDRDAATPPGDPKRTPSLKRLRLFGACAALLAGPVAGASALPTFLITQGDVLYRYQNGNVKSFPIGDIVAGLTTVPAGVTVGNLNGGASGGDALALGGNTIYRIDDPLGTPYLTPIGASGGPNASPVFVNGHLYGVGGVLPVGSIVVEWDTQTFAEINRWATGVFSGPGGMVNVAGTADEFLYLEFNGDQMWHYKLGDNFSTLVTPIGVNFDYVGVEMHNGTMYASFALPGSQQFVFGTVNMQNGSFSQIALLDSYNIGQTGLTWIVPEPGGLGLLAAGLLRLVRRR